MSDRTDIAARLLTNRREHARSLERIRTDRDASAADRTAAIRDEHRRASQRHDDLARQYRAPVAGAADDRAAPNDLNALIRMAAADARWGPLRPTALAEDAILTTALPVPPEIAR